MQRKHRKLRLSGTRRAFCCAHLVILFAFFFCIVPLDARALEKRACRDSVRYFISKLNTSEGTVTIEGFEPKSQGRHPAVLFVHGAGGVISRSEDSILPKRDNFGEVFLACNGYVVLVVHYLEPLGVRSINDTDVMHKNQNHWIRILSDALFFLANLQSVDSKRIGVLGESLGGFLALRLAATDKRVMAVSELYGGDPGLTEDDLQKLPAILIQHGEADSIVSVQEAYKLRRLLEKNRIPCAIHIYPTLEHNLNTRARKEALERSVIFFDQYLRQRRGTLKPSTCESLPLKDARTGTGR
jgi:carboxymethylenebutenolidase